MTYEVWTDEGLEAVFISQMSAEDYCQELKEQLGVRAWIKVNEGEVKP